MKFLKWKDSIQEKINSKEEILHKVEKAEIAYNIINGCWSLVAILGIVLIFFASSGSKGRFVGLALIVASGISYLETTIKSHLKLERYKALWDRMELTERAERKMNAEDL